MADRPTEVSRTDSADTIKAKKKPYVKPAFKYERVLETRALVCGKVGSMQVQCRLNTKTS